VAGQVRLFEHDDFEQAILQAAGRLGLSEQFVEKDYYVTEILRIVSQRLGGKAKMSRARSISDPTLKKSDLHRSPWQSCDELRSRPRSLSAGWDDQH
jgi:hypothetical protein